MVPEPVPAFVDPIAKLMEDHQRFLRTTRSFRVGLGPRPGPAVPDPVLPRRIAEFAGFLERDVDRLHGQQEEQGLFPALRRHLPDEGGPIEVMLGEHESLRGLQRSLEGSGRALESDAEAHGARATADRVAVEVEQLLEGHILKEDTVLFPMANQILSRAEVEEIAEVFREVERRVGPA